MAIASAVLDLIGARRRVTRNLSLTLSGNYTLGGDTLDLTATTNPNWIPAAKAFAALPDLIVLKNVPAGYSAQVIAGSALNNNLVKFFTASGTELAAGAYPAALTGGAIVAEVVTRVNQ